MSQITITLGLPDPVLSPNARVHWAVVAKAKRAYRSFAWHCAVPKPEHKGLGFPWILATAQATFYFDYKRRRDKDNFGAMLKSAWDGIVDAGVLTDDEGLTHEPVVFVVDKDTEPRVELRITRKD